MVPGRASKVSIGRHGRWIVMVALLTLAVPAAAGDPRPDFSVRAPSFGMRIDQPRLLRRSSSEFESLAAFGLLQQPGTDMHEHALFQTLRDKIKRDGKSVTRRALRDQLLMMTGLDQAFAGGRSNDRSNGASARGVRFTFGVSSLRPEVGMKYRVGDASLRFRVDSSGEVGLGLSGVGIGRTGVLATFDGGDTFAVRARLGF